MNTTTTHTQPRHLPRLIYAAGLICLIGALALALTNGATRASPSRASAPGLGEAASYSVLGKAGVTSTGNSMLSGKVGADILAAITGFPPAVAGGGLVEAPAVNQAEFDASAANDALNAQAGGAIPAGPELSGITLVPGVYNVGAATLSGVLTLDGPGTYVFLASTLTSNGSINLINGARACDVFWSVGNSADLVTGAFLGTIIAGTSVTFDTSGISLDGRALALTGNVTLINNNISGPSCPAAPIATDTPIPTDTPVPGATLAPTATLTITATSTPTDTLLPVLTNTPVPVNTNTSVPVETTVTDQVSTNTPVPVETNTPVPVVVNTLTPPQSLILIPNTGSDAAEAQALAMRQWTYVGLGVVGVSLFVLGFVLRRKSQ